MGAAARDGHRVSSLRATEATIVRCVLGALIAFGALKCLRGRPLRALGCDGHPAVVLFALASRLAELGRVS